MNPTRLEQLFRLHGDIRRRLAPIRVTPSQAGVLLVLRRHTEPRVTDAAAALGVSQATMSRTVTALMRKQCVAKRRSVKDDRVVVVLLSRRGKVLARQIEQRIRQVAEPARRALDLNRA
jgi:DNA-binding MarR family transcriptional regulator